MTAPPTTAFRSSARWPASGGATSSSFPNEENSGSVFAQWRKAAELATGDYLWIAEADDLSDPEFLARVMQAMDEDPAVVLGLLGQPDDQQRRLAPVGQLQELLRDR